MKKTAVTTNKQELCSTKKAETKYRFTFVHLSALLALNNVYELRYFVAVDPCASFPCQNGGNCSSTGRNYACWCPSGFEGPTCEQGSKELIFPF